MENRYKIYFLVSLIVLVSCTFQLRAEYELDWEASTTVNVGSGDFAPHYIMSNNGGVITQPLTIMERGKLYRELKTDKRFEYGFGIDVIGNWSKSTNYDVYNVETQMFEKDAERPPYAWIQQLWGSIKYRSVFLTIGMKENDRSIFNMELGSGDLTESNNSRPIPQVRAGFLDFVDIPFTNGWVEIQGELAYGKNLDQKWIENHYNYYDNFIATDWWYHYARCYFRSKPEMPFSVIAGMQHGAQFGGTYQKYRDGKPSGEPIHHKVVLSDFFHIFFPTQGGKGDTAGDQVYYLGNHIGSWDLRMRYRFKDNTELTAYMQSPWEDGSGIGKLNGFDGVWGIEYKAPKPGIISGAVIEYIDFTNQSGPVHFNKNDFPGTHIENHAQGCDDYYNNYMYNGWTNYGMSVGSPFIPATIYNKDGYMRYRDNRIRGFHLGVNGLIKSNLSYRVLLSYRKSWGTPFIPALEKRHDTSMMIEAIYNFAKIPNLSIKGQLAFDAGNMIGNNFGALVSLSYKGDLIFK